MEDTPLSIEQTARELGRSAPNIYRLIAEQKLAAVKVGPYTRVLKSAVETFLRTANPPQPKYKITAPRVQHSPRQGDTNGKPRTPPRRAA